MPPPNAANSSNGPLAQSNSNNTSSNHTSSHTNGHSNGAYTTHSNGTHSTTKNDNTTPPSDLSDRLTVQRSAKAFSSAAISLISLPAGALFARITGTSPGAKAYSSVQVSRTQHIELNSELLYCNHACAPTVEFDMARMEVRVARDRDLSAGDPLTFWYPSTEWEMAQPFECGCGSERCKGWISGAGQMDERVVREYWLNAHIEEMLDERAVERSE